MPVLYMFYRSIFGNSKIITNDSRVMLQLVESFTIVIYYHIFIVQATVVGTKVFLLH